MVILNDVCRIRDSHSIVFNWEAASFKHEFCYVYNDQYHDLKKATQEAGRLLCFANSRANEILGGFTFDENACFTALGFEIRE